MGMSTHIVGFKPKNEKFNKMKAIWDTCVELNIPVPQEVHQFFEGWAPDDSGVRVTNIPHKEWCGEMEQGIELNIDDLPKDVKILRFYNSW